LEFFQHSFKLDMCGELLSYRIKTIAKILGIPRNTLLAWERRYAVVTPARTANGYRTYSDHDLTVLREVQSLTQDGYAISEAVNMIRTKSSGPPLPVHSTTTLSPLQEPTNQLQDALLNFDHARAEVAMRAYRHLGFRELINAVFVPILVEIGTKWADGQISILQEHYVSGFIHDQMSGMYLQLGSGPENGPHAICAGYPEEIHEIGLMAISIQLVLEGWRVTHLGTRVPQNELIEFINVQKPVLLCVSVMYEKEPYKIAAYAETIRGQIPEDVTIAIGGQAVCASQIDVEGISIASDFNGLKKILDAIPKKRLHVPFS
jgi:DNA-binding transcriptional MerR regulator/methylmalonyl-CoA mutase cobalamin-binding subunit